MAVKQKKWKHNYWSERANNQKKISLQTQINCFRLPAKNWNRKKNLKAFKTNKFFSTSWTRMEKDLRSASFFFKLRKWISLLLKSCEKKADSLQKSSNFYQSYVRNPRNRIVTQKLPNSSSKTYLKGSECSMNLFPKTATQCL